MVYEDFELKIGAERKGEGYPVTVLRSPGGEASGLFRMPFDKLELENLVLKMRPSGRGVRRVFSPEIQAARDFGGRLFDALFGTQLRACLRASLANARLKPGTGLRIKLRLQEAPELADLPWEFLRDTELDRFFAHSDQTPLVRYVELNEPVAPEPLVLPLRILIAAPRPRDLQALDTATEIDLLRKALRPLAGIVAIDVLEPPTLAALQRQLLHGDYHVFHFIGHGGFDGRSQEGLLYFEDASGRSFPVEASRLGVMLHDERTLRLAVLNACEGARNSASDPFAGVASALIQEGVPAVVAMQFEITDGAAIRFAEQLYGALANGRPIDAAVVDARKAVLALPNDIEWATPVLYMRTHDGVLFDGGPPPNPEGPGFRSFLYVHRGAVIALVAALVLGAAALAWKLLQPPDLVLPANPWMTVTGLPIEMQKYEVSSAAFAVWRAKRDGRPPPPWEELVTTGEKPASGVPWHEADAYCRALSARLPAVAEWRAAAAGAALPPPCTALAPVGQTAADLSRSMVHDLLGNADEWSSEGPFPGAWYRLGAPCSTEEGEDDFRSALVEEPAASGAAASVAFTGFRCVRDRRGGAQ